MPAFLFFLHAQKLKFGPFLEICFNLFSLTVFFSFAFLVYQQFCCPLYRPYFAQNCAWLTFQERGKLILKEQYVKSETGSGFFPKILPFSVSVPLTGLVRISKMRYCWKDLSLKLLLFINLYPASRGPSIFLDKSGRMKRSVASQDKTGTILEPRTNRVSKHENRVSSFEKAAFFILTTRKDFRK